MSHSRDPWAYEPQFWELFERLVKKANGNESTVLELAFATERQAVWFQNKCYAFLRAREWAVRDKKVEKERIFSWTMETRACKAFQISRDGKKLMWVRKANKEVFNGVMQQIEEQMPFSQSITHSRVPALSPAHAMPFAETRETGSSVDFWKSREKQKDDQPAPAAYPFDPSDLPEEH